MSERTVLRAKGQLTLPAEVRAAARLEEGDPLEVQLTPDGILLRPLKVIDATQAWFWTPEWQAGEREASAQIAAEEGVRYETGDAFVAALENAAKPTTKAFPRERSAGGAKRRGSTGRRARDRRA